MSTPPSRPLSACPIHSKLKHFRKGDVGSINRHMGFGKRKLDDVGFGSTGQQKQEGKPTFTGCTENDLDKFSPRMISLDAGMGFDHQFLELGF